MLRPWYEMKFVLAQPIGQFKRVSYHRPRGASLAGWPSLSDGQVYPASVKALTHMSVARIDTGGLPLLMNLEPSIGYPVHRRLSLIFYRQYESALSELKVSV